MKPSQLPRKMKALLGNNSMPDTVLKKIRDKPHTHTTQILAEIADKIHNNIRDNLYHTNEPPPDKQDRYLLDRRKNDWAEISTP